MYDEREMALRGRSLASSIKEGFFNGMIPVSMPGSNLLKEKRLGQMECEWRKGTQYISPVMSPLWIFEEGCSKLMSKQSSTALDR